MEVYAAEIEGKMRRFFSWLSEKDRRRYAAVEVAKLGHGGIEYIARVLECDPKTIRLGLGELEEAEDATAGRIRKKGVDAPNVLRSRPWKRTSTMLQEFTAGDPMREGCSGPTCRGGAVATADSAGDSRQSPHDPATPAKTELGRRTARKKKTMGHHPDRNAQFENIARLRKKYLKAGDTVIQHRHEEEGIAGELSPCRNDLHAETVETIDHDFGSAGEGKLIPHGVYDVGNHHAHVHLNTSHDTSELCCDSVASWWEQTGGRPIPGDTLLVLGDGGGSNSATRYLFKEDLQRLANRLGLEIRVAHYPPYCSKYNPIEHRVFPHVTRACRGVIFHTLEIVR